MINPMTLEAREAVHEFARLGFRIPSFVVLALLGQLDDAECEIERQRGDLVIERRRAEAAEAAIARVRALAYSDAVGYSEEERIIAALDGES